MFSVNLLNFGANLALWFREETEIKPRVRDRRVAGQGYQISPPNGTNLEVFKLRFMFILEPEKVSDLSTCDSTGGRI